MNLNLLARLIKESFAKEQVDPREYRVEMIDVDGNKPVKIVFDHEAKTASIVNDA
jgi:hypothetical protein